MKKMFTILAFLAPCFAQGALTLSPPSSPRAGSTATWTVAISGATGPAALQFNFSCDHALGVFNIAAVGTALTAGKAAAAIPNGNTIVSGVNATSIADGTVATIAVALPAALANVNLTCSLSGTTYPALGASPTAAAIVETPNPPVSVLILPSLSFCDINGDGQTNTTDVTLERTSILNQTAADRNGDGRTDVVDLQIVINAALGGACTATQ